MATVEMAKSASDYELAAKEFEQAAKLAPDWPDIYYNLGSVQSKAGDITSAIKSFQRYLDLAPKSPDAAKVREEIFKLEYRRDREKLATTLTGTWTGSDGQTFELKLEGSRLQLTRAKLGDDILNTKLMGRSYTGPMNDVPLVFSGTLVGDKISGQFLQAAGRFITATCRNAKAISRYCRRCCRADAYRLQPRDAQVPDEVQVTVVGRTGLPGDQPAGDAGLRAGTEA
jgi:tetratricopeptide (TPR) repeat protein